MKYNDAISEQIEATRKLPFHRIGLLGQWGNIAGIIAVIVGLIGAFSATWLWILVAVGGVIIILLSALIKISSEVGNHLISSSAM